MDVLEELEKNIPQYKRPEGEFTYLILPPWRIKSSIFKGAMAEQLSLFPSIEDEIYQDMPKLLKQYKGTSTRIKNIAKNYGISINKAQKLYKAAFEKFVYELNRKHYLENKEYFDWLETPEAAAYIKQYIQKCDEEYERRKREFEQRIREGKEHVVRIEVNDNELQKLLDNPFYANIQYYGPFSALIQSSGLTEHDAKILWVNKHIQIEKGNPETILSYDFPPKRTENHNKFKCIICGAELDYNDIGINKKLGAKHERFFKCPKCIGITDDKKESIVRFYRSTGCNMFI